MSGQLPEHTIRREGGTSVWHLVGADGEKIAAYTTFGIQPTGGVFAITLGKGWTREMADRAFRAKLGERK